MIRYTWRVYGKPIGQPRHRVGKKRVFIPSSHPIHEWKNLVAAAIVNEGYPPDPLTGPVCCDLVFRMPRPNSHYNREGLKARAPKDHIQKPDRDNLEKAVLDVMERLGVYVNDSQVNDGRVLKRWSAAEDAGVEIHISAPH